MSCGALTYGFDYECNDGVGGVKQGSILVSQWDGITASTVSAGIVTAITAGTWYRYQVRSSANIAGETTTMTADPTTGAASYSSTFVWTLFNMSGSKNVQLELLTGKPLAIIYQDNNDVYHILGLTNGVDVTTVDKQSGAAFTDMNGYTITATGMDKAFPYEVQSSVVAGLTISGSLS